MIGPLAEKFRVVVPDHMGFGKSETPQDRVYTLQTHVENLELFVADLDLSDITIVCQDWGWSYRRCVYSQKPPPCETAFFL
jgi:haloalkane dehalogenase